MKNKEELPMNLDRGAWQRPLDFAREEPWSLKAKLFRAESTDPACSDQPALDVSPEEALMELIVSPHNLRRAWRQVKGNRGARDLNRYERGWVGYFGLARQFEDIAKLDGWIRRRVRMCYWKQWRYPRTKVKKLVALGVSLDMAIKHAVSRKKYWRMSRTPALRYAMTNKWPRATRLVIIKATLVRVGFSSRNRLVRTRMLGGVGAAVSNGGGYPIYPASHLRTRSFAASPFVVRIGRKIY